MRLLMLLGFLDQNGFLSLTNFALFAVLIKVLFFQADVATALLFLIATLNYMYKRFELAKAVRIERKTIRLATIETQIQELKLKLEEYKKTAQLVEKQAEETKKLISNTHLNQAFIPRHKRTGE